MPIKQCLFFSFKKNLILHCWRVVPLFICIVSENFQSKVSFNSSRIIRLLGLYLTEKMIVGTNPVPGVGCQSLMCVYRSVLIATSEDGTVIVIIMTNTYWALTAWQAKCCIHIVWFNSFISDPRGRYYFHFQFRSEEAHTRREEWVTEMDLN